MRFLHIADVHLDTPFASRSPALRERLRAATREAIRSATSLAIAEKVHAVLVAGDLFEGDHLSFASERYLVQEFLRLSEADIPVIYATGNHDPGEALRRIHALQWPPNVTLVRESTPVRTPILDRQGNEVGGVTAAGHSQRWEEDDLSVNFPRPEGSLPEVALLHTQVQESARQFPDRRYAPSQLETLRKSGYHYWALGHVHERQLLSEHPPVCYPGNLQGRSPRETGAKGGYLVDLSTPDRPQLTFHAFGPVEWQTLTVSDLEEFTTFETLIAHLSNAWKSQRGDAIEAEQPRGSGLGAEQITLILDGTGEPSRTADRATREIILILHLEGPSPLWREFASPENLETLGDELGQALGVLAVEVRADRVYAPVKVDDHAQRRDVLGEALRHFREIMESGRLPESVDASELAGADPGASPDVKADYVRQILRGGDAEILARLFMPGDDP